MTGGIINGQYALVLSVAVVLSRADSTGILNYDQRTRAVVRKVLTEFCMWVLELLSAYQSVLSFPRQYTNTLRMLSVYPRRTHRHTFFAPLTGSNTKFLSDPPTIAKTHTIVSKRDSKILQYLLDPDSRK